MRTFILLLSLPLLFASCSKYQYLTVSSDNTNRNQQNDFVVENDTARITYRFFGYNGPMQLTVFNKTSSGLRVDWSRSFLVRGTHPVPFHTPSGSISGELARGGRYDNTSVIQANFIQPSLLEFIPPQTQVTKGGYPVVQQSSFSTDNYTMVREKIKSGKYGNKIKKATLTKENTPLSFRIYVTLVSESSPDKSMVVDREFYISEIVTSNARPHDLYPNDRNGNRISLERSTTTGMILGTVAFLGALGALVAIAGN